MKNKLLIIGAVLCFYVAPSLKAQDSSGKTAQKLFDMVVGNWTLANASETGSKTSKLPQGDMYSIEFTREAKYIIRNQSLQPYDSGFYRANEDHKLIYLQSSFHPSEQPAEWHASIKDSMLTLTKKESGDKKSADKKTMYVYHRHSNSTQRK